MFFRALDLAESLAGLTNGYPLGDGSLVTRWLKDKDLRTPLDILLRRFPDHPEQVMALWFGLRADRGQAELALARAEEWWLQELESLRSLSANAHLALFDIDEPSVGPWTRHPL